ncbi:CYFA0S01e03312g1_1 [Cyberlindnera fabianii]|uniref:CYFA0S01e03312g1_1 n=1 Tax=Cyberlindnera fabianii TaxID=36022 RepID=A0A061AGH6_CYBFA|nr:CYFA0S01e03312g1_1 [Cyberlindnera fabianii]
MAPITVTSRSKSIKSDVYDNVSSYEQFIEQVSKKNKNLSIYRIRVTDVNKKVISTTAELLNTGEVQLKDLGPQIGWRTVYLIEYAGPLIFHYLAYQLFGRPIDYDLLYKMQIFHYAKREVENVFVHKFSNSTMPLFNLFKNCGHYWILGSSLALMYGDWGNFTIPGWNPTKGNTTQYIFYFWCFAQFFNAVSHIQLRLLGEKTIRMGRARKAPEGGFFEIYIAPNYTLEIYGWICVFLMNPNIFSLVFLTVGAVQMYFWSQKKNAKYGTNKSFLIPFVL